MSADLRLIASHAPQECLDTWAPIGICRHNYYGVLGSAWKGEGHRRSSPSGWLENDGGAAGAASRRAATSAHLRVRTARFQQPAEAQIGSLIRPGYSFFTVPRFSDSHEDCVRSPKGL